MALTDEASLLREKLRELQDKNDILHKIVVQYYIDGDSDLVREMVDKYLGQQKPDVKPKSE